jgi:ribonuclease BN (tRNA processing enzyme)
MNDIKLVFYGVRGSYPVSGKDVLKYGGNTPSILIDVDGQPLILDAGTGIIGIGTDLKKNRPDLKKIDIFLTHFHMDHIQGIPFFEPVFDPEFQINIYCNENPEVRLEDTIYGLFNQPLSPIGNEGIKAQIKFKILDMNHKETITIGNTIAIDYIKETHPVAGVLIYRLSIGDKRIVYATDVESPDGFSENTIGFMKGADILIHDTMYFDRDYYSPQQPKKGYGHSTVSMAVENARKAEVKKLFLFHYNPNYSDKDIEKLYQEAKEKFKNTYLSEELKNFRLRR